MVFDLYEGLLKEFAQAAGFQELKPDSNNSCLIALPNKAQVFLEIDPKNSFLIMGSTLGFLPGGRYRETVLKEALKANGLPYPQFGHFAFSKKNEKLVMLSYLNLQNLTGSKIHDHFVPFLEKATAWKEALEKGEVPSLFGNYSTHKGGTGMFGL